MAQPRGARAAGLIALLLLTYTTASAQQADTALASLVRAELAFADQAAREGVRPAFLAWLSDDAIIFTPDPANGLEHHRALPDSPARLAWYPTRAAVSAAGDLGYSTGPYEFRAAASDPQAYRGQFASVWRRSDDGDWRVALDLGSPAEVRPSRVSRLDPERLQSSRQRSAGVQSLRTVEQVAALRDSILQLDAAFARSAGATGTREALDQLAAPDIRLIRPGASPADGRGAVRRLLSREPGRPAWEPRDGGAARSGDLAYVWGAVAWLASDSVVERGYYLRVWRRERGDGWRVVLDLVAPRPLTPPPAPSGASH